METQMEDLLFLANLQHDTRRPEEEVETAKKMVALNPAFDKNERSVFGQAYKDAIDPLRSSLKSLTTVLSYYQDGEQIALADKISMYKAATLTKLQTLCTEAVETIEKTLLPNAIDNVSRAFYEKMKGDMYRYINEYVDGDSRDKALEAYTTAVDISKTSLPDFHPVRLGSILNFAVFTYEHLAQASTAINMLKEACDGNMADEMSDETKKEALQVLKVMQSNLQNWTRDESPDEEEEEETE